MTMRLTIKNEDAARTAVVVTEDFQMGNPLPSCANIDTLTPGKSCEVYIHASRRVVVTEDALATIPKPTATE